MTEKRARTLCAPGACAGRDGLFDGGLGWQAAVIATGFGVYTFHARILVGTSILLLPLAMHPLGKALLAAGLAWVASTAFAWVVRKIPAVERMLA